MKIYPNIRPTLSNSNSQQFIEKLNKAIREDPKLQNINMEQYHNLSALLVFLVNGMMGLQKKQSSDDNSDEIEYIATFVKGGVNFLGLNK